MHKILALDLGDQWVGSAISDSSRMFARPYQTVAAAELEKFLKQTIDEELVDIVVVGYPKTMRGTKSLQTERVIKIKEQLEKKMPQIQWILWDERLTSKYAQQLGATKTKEEKLKSHSRAAAFILDSYLMFLQVQKENIF